MKSTKLRRFLLALVLVPMAIAVTVSGFAAVASAKSPDVDKKVSEAVDTFITTLPDNGFRYISAEELDPQLGTADAPFLLDVQTDELYADNGHIAGATHISILDLLDNLDKLPAKDQPIVTYCGIGHNGTIAMMSLTMLGYTNVRSLGGGLYYWANVGKPVVK